MSENSIFQHSNVLTRNQNISDNGQKMNAANLKSASKRPASSPAKGSVQKRSAFGNITNAIKNTKQFELRPLVEKLEISKPTIRKRRSLRLQSKQTLQKSVPDIKSDDSNLTINSLETAFSSAHNSRSTTRDEAKSSETMEVSPVPTCYYEYEVSPKRKELNFDDLDAFNATNNNEAPEYAFMIFEYMRSREKRFVIKAKYLANIQKEVTADMRAILVDWMVEVQENFELNHETLYLAVKLVDHYMQKVNIIRERLQLVGATSLLVAAKFDERHAPYVDDFLYICDDAYTKKDMLAMERSILIVIGFDINIPIAYRFLRRYAKCLKSSMEVLTLARFVLELSLQCYNFVDRSASKMAAAALWLAIKMKNTPHQWDDTLLYYTSHEEREIFDLAHELNNMVNKSKGKKLKTVWQKYSHSIFYEVAKTPTLSEDRIEDEKRRIYAKSDASFDSSKDFFEL
ncbi:unnamed protein product [Clavelina lepadiformis]|uniref:G2/mitotic-specific cyclin-B3 n=1 Tax=Clavelina lepadiformis TaxID=159417 RepID=A0ABP0FSZ3_CLALP